MTDNRGRLSSSLLAASIAVGSAIVAGLTQAFPPVFLKQYPMLVWFLVPPVIVLGAIVDSRRRDAERLNSAADQTKLPPPKVGTEQRRVESWGTAPADHGMVGRSTDYQTLRSHLTAKSGLFGIFGPPGIGKTALASAAARASAKSFAHVFWQSLVAVPAIEDVCDRWLSEAGVSVRGQSPMVTFAGLLRTQRCLLVIDNFETALDLSVDPPRISRDLTNYAEFIGLLAAAHMRSCVIVTSTIRFSPFLGTSAPQSIDLAGLDALSGELLLRRSSVTTAAPTRYAEIIEQYGGNPEALLRLSNYVSEAHGGNLDLLASSEHDRSVLPSLADLLERQLRELPPPYYDVLLWLAMWRQRISLEELSKQCPLYNGEIARLSPTESLAALRRRRLCDIANGTIRVPSVPLELITQKVITTIAAEVRESHSNLLARLPLTSALYPDDVQSLQRRFLLDPIIATVGRRSAMSASRSEANAIFAARLASLPRTSPPSRGFVAANLFELLSAGGWDFTGADLSQLDLGGVDCRGLRLENVSLQQCDLSGARFAELLGTVHSVAIQPATRFVAAGTAEGTVKMWDLRDGRLVKSYSQHRAVVRSVAFSHDGRYLASAGEDSLIAICDTATGHCVRLKGHSNWVWQVAFDPTGCLLFSIACDGTAKIWSVIEGTELVNVPVGVERSWAIAVGQDRFWVASEDGKLRTWQWSHAIGSVVVDTQPTIVGAIDAPIKAIALADADTALVSGDTLGRLMKWTLATGTSELLASNHIGTIRTIAVDHQRRILYSGGDDSVINVTDVATGALNAHYRGHTARVWAAAYGGHEQILASVGDDHSIRIWGDNREGLPRLSVIGHSKAIRSLAWAATTVVMACQDDLVRAWQMGTENPHLLRVGGSRAISHVDNVGRHVVAASEDGVVLLIDRDSQHVTHRWVAHSSPISALAVTTQFGGVIATGSEDRTIRLWQFDGTLLATLGRHVNRVWTMAFSPDGTRLFSGGGDNILACWSSNGALLWERDHHTNPVRAVTARAANGVVSGGDDGLVCLWNADGSVESKFEVPVLARTLGHIEGRLIVGGPPKDRETMQSLWLLDPSSDKIVPIDLGTPTIVQSIATAEHHNLVAIGTADGEAIILDSTNLKIASSMTVPSLYAKMNVRDVRGIDSAQLEALHALGAIS